MISVPTLDRHDLTLFDLPTDILYLILEYLEIWDVSSCRRVSKHWRQILSRPEWVRATCRRCPRARATAELLQHDPTVADITSGTRLDRLARQYHNLRHGKVRKPKTYKLRSWPQYVMWCPVAQWRLHESQPGGHLYSPDPEGVFGRSDAKPRLFEPTIWSYDDGLVACAIITEGEEGDVEDEEHILSIVDLATGDSTRVPFDITGKVLRNITLRHRTLVIEWAEKDAYHALNAWEEVHRHFATCFDVRLSEDSKRWQATFRNELKMHFLGLPLNATDRFHSTHNGQHYAIYFWQPSRGMYTDDEDMPIESLFVWDISIPSSYQPSLDSSGKHRPPEHERPHPICIFPFRDLEFYDIRQHSVLSFMNLRLDSDACSIDFRETVCVAAQGYFDPGEHLLRTTITTTIPFSGTGPANRQTKDGGLPLYHGHCSTLSADIEEVEKWFVPIMDVYDDVADIRFSLVQTCFTGMGLDNQLVIRIKSADHWTTLDDKLTAQVSPTGMIAGDERWLVGQNLENELVVLHF